MLPQPDQTFKTFSRRTWIALIATVTLFFLFPIVMEEIIGIDDHHPPVPTPITSMTLLLPFAAMLLSIAAGIIGIAWAHRRQKSFDGITFASLVALDISAVLLLLAILGNKVMDTSGTPYVVEITDVFSVTRSGDHDEWYVAVVAHGPTNIEGVWHAGTDPVSIKLGTSSKAVRHAGRFGSEWWEYESGYLASRGAAAQLAYKTRAGAATKAEGSFSPYSSIKHILVGWDIPVIDHTADAGGVQPAAASPSR